MTIIVVLPLHDFYFLSNSEMATLKATAARHGPQQRQPLVGSVSMCLASNLPRTVNLSKIFLFSNFVPATTNERIGC